MHIPIRNAFDVVLARKMLRRNIARQGWEPAFRARASLTLTALIEVLFEAHTPGILDIRLIKTNGTGGGVEFNCDVQQALSQEFLAAAVQSRLGPVSDEVQIIEGHSCPRIVARLHRPPG